MEAASRMLLRIVSSVRSNLYAFWPIALLRLDRHLTSQIHPLRIPLEPNVETGWKPYWLFAGTTSDGRNLSCHASVLATGACPHPPHSHREEEMLILLSGRVELLLPSHPGQAVILEPGQLVYYPAGFPHSLRTVGRRPANYLMFKWRGRARSLARPLVFSRYAPNSEDTEERNAGFRTTVLFEGPTAYLGKLHSHVSILAPGAGYLPHRDDYDVAIVLLEGQVETLGHRVRPHDVVFYSRQDLHGIHNPGAVPARYLVFEFHRARRSSIWRTVVSRHPGIRKADG